jgi:predicted nucleotidyltransferase
MSSPDAADSDLLQVLDRLARILNECQVAYALIGGLAVAVRGPIRATRDIDLLVQVPQVELPRVLTALANDGFLLDVPQAIGVWNRDSLLDFTCGSIRIDWLKPVLPAFADILRRARWEEVGERRIRVADAEGLLLLKLIAFRGRDQEDIKGILAANAGTLDLDWLRRELHGLVTDEDPRRAQFDSWVHEYYDAS